MAVNKIPGLAAVQKRLQNAYNHPQATTTTFQLFVQVVSCACSKKGISKPVTPRGSTGKKHLALPTSLCNTSLHLDVSDIDLTHTETTQALVLLCMIKEMLVHKYFVEQFRD